MPLTSPEFIIAVKEPALIPATKGGKKYSRNISSGIHAADLSRPFSG